MTCVAQLTAAPLPPSRVSASLTDYHCFLILKPSPRWRSSSHIPTVRIARATNHISQKFRTCKKTVARFFQICVRTFARSLSTKRPTFPKTFILRSASLLWHLCAKIHRLATSVEAVISASKARRLIVAVSTLKSCGETCAKTSCGPTAWERR